MVATAARTDTAVRRRAALRGERLNVRVGAVRRPRSRAWRFSKALLVVSIVAFLFGYVSVYARLTVAGYSCDRLSSDCRQARLEHERLELLAGRLSNPECVVAAAEKTGMVYATRYDYLHKQDTLASAARP